MNLRFRDADPAGILFFARAFELSSDAYEEFITQALGIPWSEWFANPVWAAPIGHAESDYHSPMKAGDVIDISVSVKDIGKTSFTTSYVFVGRSSTIHWEATLVHVFVRKGDRGRLPIPLEIRERLESYRG